jgi:hypothetical protein
MHFSFLSMLIIPIPVLVSVKRLSEHQGLVKPEGFGKLKKKSLNSSNLEPAAFPLVV